MDNIITTKKNTNKAFECTICIETNITSVSTIKCGHSFCKACTDRMVNNDKIICPLCRREYEVKSYITDFCILNPQMSHVTWNYDSDSDNSAHGDIDDTIGNIDDHMEQFQSHADLANNSLTKPNSLDLFDNLIDALDHDDLEYFDKDQLRNTVIESHVNAAEPVTMSVDIIDGLIDALDHNDLDTVNQYFDKEPNATKPVTINNNPSNKHDTDLCARCSSSDIVHDNNEGILVCRNCGTVNMCILTRNQNPRHSSFAFAFAFSAHHLSLYPHKKIDHKFI